MSSYGLPFILFIQQLPNCEEWTLSCSLHTINNALQIHKQMSINVKYYYWLQICIIHDFFLNS